MTGRNDGTVVPVVWSILMYGPRLEWMDLSEIWHAISLYVVVDAHI